MKTNNSTTETANQHSFRLPPDASAYPYFTIFAMSQRSVRIPGESPGGKSPKDGQKNTKGPTGSPDHRSDSDRSSGEPSRWLYLTVKSVMAGVAETKIQITSTATVGTLKRIVAEATSVAIEKQLIIFNDNELRDDDSPISYYGIVEDCAITVNVKMTAGSAKGSSASLVNLFLTVPIALPTGAGLRPAVRGMSNVRAKPGKKMTSEKPAMDEKTKAEREMENHIIRNKMRSLLKKRKKTAVFSNGGEMTPSKSSVNASVIGSVSASPLRTPQNEAEGHAAAGISPANSLNSEEEPTEKELKLFFEPAESMEQLHMKRQDMHTPPQNLEELQQLKKEMDAEKKMKCKQCRKKLPLASQSMACLCGEVYCKNHRGPEQHLCSIDYKQTGRTKLQKENPKVDGDGVRKAKLAK